LVMRLGYGEFHHMLLKTGPLYDPLVKVPLIIEQPRPAGHGRVDERLTSGIDIVPTVLTSFGPTAGALPEPEGRATSALAGQHVL
jgi:arylsulfatase A-like enzyme